MTRRSTGLDYSSGDCGLMGYAADIASQTGVKLLIERREVSDNET